MFDFFFKRVRPGRASDSGAAVKGGSAPTNASAAPLEAASSAASSALLQRRQVALDQAAALGADEQAALAFVLVCPVPEARLQAAAHLHSRAMLEQALKAMRETDRRVVKLMQQRLSDLAQQERSAQRMQAAIARAQAMLAEPIVLANQLVELDRAQAEAGAATADLASDFLALRTQLADRLHAQAALQRRAMDLKALLHATLAAHDGVALALLEATLQSADAATLDIERDPALPGLPKHLMPELRAARSHLHQRLNALKASEAALAAREQALAEWEGMLATAGREAGEVQGDDNQSGDSADADAALPAQQVLPTPQALRQQWRTLPELSALPDPEMAAALQARFDALLAAIAPPVRQDRKSRPAPATGSNPADSLPQPAPVNATTGADADQSRMQQTVALQELRSALDEGALQRAVEQDRLLRSLDGGATLLNAGQLNDLSAARVELSRLQGWARWGGTVSREELVVAVESLPQQGLGVSELGKKVGSMRERWRALDATAGPAPRPLWLRFDAACGVAYAPVAAHFAELARQREERLEKARAILAEVSAFVAATGLASDAGSDTAAAPDWRAMGAFCQRMEQAWQRLGPVERKQQKQINAAFEQALQPLRQALHAQQEQAIALRETMIADVLQLAPQGRETLDRLQVLQGQWQLQAKALPLARAQEQQLWQRFRCACDAVFAQRKHAAVSADAERAANLAAKNALCLALEEAAAEDRAGDAARAALLHQTKLAWDAIGPVPRAAQAALQARFEQALAAVQGQRNAARQHAVQLQSAAFETVLGRCLDCERQLLAASDRAGQTLPEAWQSPENLAPPLEQALQARFAAAQAALAQRDALYAHSLQENSAALDTALLRLEVRLGIDSPPAFARERLQLQVAGLQSTFRSGSGAAAADTPLLQLARACALAAATAPPAEARLKAISRAILGAS